MDPQLRRKIYITMGAIAGIVILILLITFIGSLLFGSNKSYAQVEDIMEEAAISYYRDNEQLLPKDETTELRVDVDTLVDAGKMNPLTDLLENDTCTGSVVVIKNNDSYLYTPYLECSDEYKTETMAGRLTDQSNIVATGDGIYFMNNEYVYRGEVENNYLQLGETMFQVVKITSDNKLMLIATEIKEEYDRYYWDNRYNSEKSANTGINDYDVSRVNDRLLEIYDIDSFLSDKTLVTTGNFCIGKRGESDSTNDGSIECSVLAENDQIGLLPAYDFINASIDQNCNSIDDPECQNYNYLKVVLDDAWLSTTNNANTYEVYQVTSTGKMDAKNANISNQINPVIYLTPSAMYSSGTGTFEDPYIVR